MTDLAPLTGQNIICIASSNWDAMWVNAQHLMSRLSRENNVLYINNMGLRPPGISKADLSKIWRRLWDWTRPAAKVTEGLFLLSPMALPFHRYSIIRKLNRLLLYKQIKKWATRLNLDDPILWIFLPTGFSLVGKMNEKGVVYHCVDDYGQNPSVPSEFIKELEKKLLAAADLTIVTSPKLFDDKKPKARAIKYFPNTADVPRFRDFKGDPPEFITKLKGNKPGGKIIGYQGNISKYKTDISLLEKIAKTFPKDHLVLVGPEGWGDPTTDLTTLARFNNAHFAGKVPYDELPSWLHSFDACLIPMNINESTKSSFPMKFYEYLACGKPVVSVSLPAFDEYKEKPGIVRLAGNNDQFLASLSLALNEKKDEGLVNARIREAEKNDWEKRVVEIGHEVGKAILREGE